MADAFRQLNPHERGVVGKATRAFQGQTPLHVAESVEIARRR